MNTRTLRRTTAASAATLLLLGASACGGSGTTHRPGAQPSVPNASVDPNGLKASGDGFSFTAPKGWSDVTSSIQKSQPQVGLAVSAPRSSSSFTTNINVIVNNTQLTDPPTQSELSSLEKELVKGIGSMSSDIKVLPRVTIDGAVAVASAGHLQVSGVKDFLQQYAVPHGGKVYVISCSFDPAWSKAQRQSVVDQVLASWSWQ